MFQHGNHHCSLGISITCCNFRLNLKYKQVRLITVRQLIMITHLSTKVSCQRGVVHEDVIKTWIRFRHYWPSALISTERPVIRSFDVFFDVSPNKLLNKQSSFRWFETPWYSCDVTVMTIPYCTTGYQCVAQSATMYTLLLFPSSSLW